MHRSASSDIGLGNEAQKYKLCVVGTQSLKITSDFMILAPRDAALATPVREWIAIVLRLALMVEIQGLNAEASFLLTWSWKSQHRHAS